MFLWEFFLGEDSSERDQLGKAVFTAARVYNKTLKHRMKKSKRFLFFTVRTGIKVSMDKSIRVIARESDDGWTIVLDMIIEKFEKSRFPVNMFQYQHITGIHAMYDGVGQWSLKYIKVA